MPQGPDQPEERVYYNIEAQFSDGSKKLVLAQIVYPLEALQRERERKSRPGADPSMMEPMSNPMSMQGGDYAERLKEDPFKDLTKEEQVVAAKTAAINQEVENLRKLNRLGVIFPRLIGHDPKKLITLTEGVGTRRLDDELHGIDQVGRRELLAKVVEDLAVFHDKGKDLASTFPPGAGHTEKKIREGLQNSLANWELIGAPITQEQFLEVLDAARPLLETTQAETGLRLVDSSPRGFYMHGNKPGRIAWEGVREDVSAFDVIELVCDPAVALSVDDELSLFNLYLQKRELDEAEKDALARDMLRLAIYYRLVLLGYLAQYRAAKMDKQGGIKYWGSEALPTTVRNLRAEMEREPEMTRLLELLRPSLENMERQQ
jgi:aminoglycoside/choline kinase family phosphotransferase